MSVTLRLYHCQGRVCVSNFVQNLRSATLGSVESYFVVAILSLSLNFDKTVFLLNLVSHGFCMEYIISNEYYVYVIQNGSLKVVFQFL